MDRLPDGHDVSGLAPWCVGGQDERGLQDDLVLRVGQEVARPAHGHGALLARGSHGLIHLLPCDLAVGEHASADTQIRQSSGQSHRIDSDFLGARGEYHRSVESLDGLRLGFRSAVSEEDAVAGELPVAGTVTKVAAVGEELTA